MGLDETVEWKRVKDTCSRAKWVEVVLSLPRLLIRVRLQFLGTPSINQQSFGLKCRLFYGKYVYNLNG